MKPAPRAARPIHSLFEISFAQRTCCYYSSSYLGDTQYSKLVAGPSAINIGLLKASLNVPLGLCNA
eukprot:scaffold40354_cov32-Tisochrysis_lutea.AAC.1